MGSLYNAATQLFYQLSLLFFWPVVVALLVLLAVSLYDLGRLMVEAYRRRRRPVTDLAGVAVALSLGMSNRQHSLSGVSMSPALARFWNRVDAHLDAVGSRTHMDVWLEEALQHEEASAAGRLDRTRALVRLGPMLGLAGTIIPLGPALRALLDGNLPDMVNHLVVGFGAVVCGLVLSGIAYLTSLVRERWARRDLQDIQHVCELLLRALGAQPRTGEKDYESILTT